MHVLLADSIDPAGERHLCEGGAKVTLAPDGNAATIRALASRSDAIITRSRLPDDIFDAAPRVRAVCIHGTGTDLVPLASANEHAVAIANQPGGNAQSVAEYCAMAILMLARNVTAITTSLRREPWDQARLLGEHNEEIYRGLLGKSAAELARLKSAGIV